MGSLPEKSPLWTSKKQELPRMGYSLWPVTFNSHNRIFVSANLYVPDAKDTLKRPGLVIVGDAREGKSASYVQRAAYLFVKSGYYVVAYDEIGTGERGAVDNYMDPNHEVYGNIKNMLLERPLPYFTTYDALRAVDLLYEQKGVDKNRIAILGSGAGALTALNASIVDERIKALALSDITSTSDYTKLRIMNIRSQLPNAFKKGITVSTLMALYAPRPLILLSAKKDTFNKAEVLGLSKRIKKIYSIAGKTGQYRSNSVNLAGPCPPGNQDACLEFINKHFKISKPAADMSSFSAEPEHVLTSTESKGIQALRGLDLHLFAKKELSFIEMGRKTPQIPEEVAAYKKRLKDIFGSKLGYSRTHPATEIKTFPIEAKGRLNRMQVQYKILGQIPVKTVLFTAKNMTEPYKTLIFLSDKGSEALENDIPAVRYLVTQGFAVFYIPEMRVNGDSAELIAGTIPGDLYYCGYLGVLVGRTILGIELESVNRAIDVLERNPKVDKNSIACFGNRKNGITALLAAAMDSRIKTAIARQSLFSYSPVINNVSCSYMKHLEKLLVPGMLNTGDLNDVSSIISPRPVLLLNPSDHNGEISYNSRIKTSFSKVKTIYRLEGQMLSARLEQNITAEEELRTIIKWLIKHNK
jgi:cephalosporin-C deacetylase-like acetyl esterase